MERASQYKYLMVFDHPYFAAVHKRKLIETLIRKSLEAGHEIVNVRDLCNIEDLYE